MYQHVSVEGGTKLHFALLTMAKGHSQTQAKAFQQQSATVYSSPIYSKSAGTVFV
jgi:hypothetical protein